MKPSKSRAENVINVVKSRAKNVINMVKSRAENVITVGYYINNQ